MKKTNIIFFLIFFLHSCAYHQVTGALSLERNPASFQTCFENMSAFFKTPKKFSSSDRPFHKAESLGKLESFYKNDSFLEIQQLKTQEEIVENNRRLLELLELPLEQNLKNDRTAYVVLDEAKTLLNDVKNSKVNKDYDCYDPKGTIGFCFGRATIAHMQALVRGVSPDSVKKIWIVGDMDEWGHHVATLVKAEDGWYVIDTVVGKIVKPAEWIANFRPTEVKEAMVFVSSAERFGPYDSSTYSAVTLFNTATEDFDSSTDFYRGYFHDYFEDLSKKRTLKKFPVR